jgi:LacI family transcriptional regulator
VIQHRGIRGVIIGQLMREDFVTKFPWSEFCAVACNTGYYKAPLHLVMPDYSHAVKRAFHEAYRRGYRRIGMVLFDEPSAIDDFDKVSGFLYCQSFLPSRAGRVPVAHFGPTDGGRLKTWLKDYRPDCVFGLNDAVAFWIRDCGYRVPEDIGFVSLMGPGSEDACDSMKKNGMTTLDHCAPLLGQTALEQLDIQLRTNQLGVPLQPITMMVEAVWVEGTSLPDRSNGRLIELESGRAASNAVEQTTTTVA